LSSINYILWSSLKRSLTQIPKAAKLLYFPYNLQLFSLLIKLCFVRFTRYCWFFSTFVGLEYVDRSVTDVDKLWFLEDDVWNRTPRAVMTNRRFTTSSPSFVWPPVPLLSRPSLYLATIFLLSHHPST
jgi:hypothetical protein